MSRIEACFNALKNSNKKALIPFITAGDPSPELTVGLMHNLVEAGADIIELGVPFSDPMADGPVIQRASERALANGTNTDDVFNMVKEFRTRNETTPVILMGYLNPIEVMGYKQFAETAANVGVDGLIVDYFNRIQVAHQNHRCSFISCPEFLNHVKHIISIRAIC